MNIQEILNKLVEGNDLTQKEAQSFVDACASGKATQSQIAGVLTALRQKGETTDEIAGFIKGMRKHMIQIQKSRPKAEFKIQNLIDVCGTGGDGKQTFNISTTVAFVAAGAGAHVAKHGNRAASSKCGSADVLEALGVRIMLSPQQAEAVLQQAGIVFLFAPLFHPATKTIAPVRKELGIRTVFNFLGPFLNPAQVKRQIIGVLSKEIAQKLSQVALKLNYKHLLLVTSEDKMDEISISTKTTVFEIKGKRLKKFDIEPSLFGLKKASISQIKGGDASANAQIIKDILKGEEGPRRDIVVLNSAFALFVSGKAKSPQEGIALAVEALESGKAKEKLDQLIKISNTTNIS